MRLLIFPFLFTLATFAQAVPDLPQYAAGAGISYNHYASPAIAAGYVSFAVRVGTTPAYSLTTVDLTSKSTTVRQEGAFVLARQGKLALLALGGLGLSLGGGTAVAGFSGGGGILYGISDRIQLSGSIRLASCNGSCSANTGGSAVQAVGALGIWITFK